MAIDRANDTNLPTEHSDLSAKGKSHGPPPDSSRTPYSYFQFTLNTRLFRIAYVTNSPPPHHTPHSVHSTSSRTNGRYNRARCDVYAMSNNLVFKVN